VSAMIGMTFGLLFRNESSNLGAGVALGMAVWPDLVVPGADDAVAAHADGCLRHSAVLGSRRAGSETREGR